MSSQQQVIEALYNFLTSVNPQGAADLNTEDTVWDFPGDPSRTPFSGIWEGQQGVLDWYASLATIQLTDFTRLEYLENGNKVAVRIRETGQTAITQIPYQGDITQLWTLNDQGEITGVESFTNTYVFNQSYAGVTPNPILPNDLIGQEVVIDQTADPDISLQIVENFWTALTTGEEFDTYLADDVVWSHGSNGDTDILPFTGVFTEPEGVETWIETYDEDLEIGTISITESFVEGNRVLLRLFEDDTTVDANGNTFDQDILSWVTVEDGKIQSVQNIVDNNIAVQALFPGDEYPLGPNITDEPTPIIGTPEGDVLVAGVDDFTAIEDTIFTGAGPDQVDFAFSSTAGNNRLFSGSGDDLIDVSQDDRVFGGSGDDTLDATLSEGGNRMSGGDGDDTFFLGSNDRALGGEGDDTFYVQTGGDNLLAGGSGADVFRIVNGEPPESANTITDFEIGIDSIVVAGIGASSIGDLTFTQMDHYTMISFGGDDLATLLNTQSTELQSSGLFEFTNDTSIPI